MLDMLHDLKYMLYNIIMLLSLADQICVHIVPYSPLLVVPYQLGLLLSLAEVLAVIGAGSRSQIVLATPNSQPC